MTDGCRGSPRTQQQHDGAEPSPLALPKAQCRDESCCTSRVRGFTDGKSRISLLGSWRCAEPARDSPPGSGAGFEPQRRHVGVGKSDSETGLGRIFHGNKSFR